MQLEILSGRDGAWYGGDVSLEESRLRLHFECFGSEDDEFWEQALTTADRMKAKMRPRSQQLQDSECTTVQAGMIVCAKYKSRDKSVSKYYDARVVAVHHRKHSLKTSRGQQEVCKCRFIVAWEAGPDEDQEVRLRCAQICVISTEDVGKHPVAKLLLGSSQRRSEDLTAGLSERPKDEVDVVNLEKSNAGVSERPKDEVDVVNLERSNAGVSERPKDEIDEANLHGGLPEVSCSPSQQNIDSFQEFLYKQISQVENIERKLGLLTKILKPANRQRGER